MKLILAAALCTMLPSALNADGFPPRLLARLDEKLAEKVWIAKEHKSAYQIQKSFKQEIYADGVGSITVEVEIFLKTDGTPKVAKIFVLDASKGQPAMVNEWAKSTAKMVIERLCPGTAKEMLAWIDAKWDSGAHQTDFGPVKLSVGQSLPRARTVRLQAGEWDTP